MVNNGRHEIEDWNIHVSCEKNTKRGTAIEEKIGIDNRGCNWTEPGII